MHIANENREKMRLDIKDKFTPKNPITNDMLTHDKTAENTIVLDKSVENMFAHDTLTNDMFTGNFKVNKCDVVKIDIKNGRLVENNCNTYKIYECQLGSNEILTFEKDAADRARSLAAFQRLYSIDYENGTWL